MGWGEIVMNSPDFIPPERINRLYSKRSLRRHFRLKSAPSLLYCGFRDLLDDTGDAAIEEMQAKRFHQDTLLRAESFTSARMSIILS